MRDARHGRSDHGRSASPSAVELPGGEAAPPCPDDPRHYRGAAGAAERVIFDARIEAHRSLRLRGHAVLMALFFVMLIVHGIVWWRAGAPFVFAFMGLDFLGIAVAFHLSRRSGLAAEEVRVSRTELLVRKIVPSGRAYDYRFNPAWTRLHVDRHEELGVRDIALQSRGWRMPVGMILNPEDRESFARELGSALAAAKR